jgi:hypothetical protein
MNLDDSGIPTDIAADADEKRDEEKPEPKRHFHFTIPENCHITKFDAISDVRRIRGW